MEYKKYSDAMVKLRMDYELWKLYAERRKLFSVEGVTRGGGMTFYSCRSLCAFHTVNTARYAIEENRSTCLLDAFV